MNRFNGGQGAGAGSQRAGMEQSQAPNQPPAPKSKVPNPKLLSGLGAQIAGLQARLGNRPPHEQPGNTEDTE
jgi:hypothetical protein